MTTDRITSVKSGPLISSLPNKWLNHLEKILEWEILLCLIEYSRDREIRFVYAFEQMSHLYFRTAENKFKKTGLHY